MKQDKENQDEIAKQVSRREKLAKYLQEKAKRFVNSHYVDKLFVEREIQMQSYA